MSNNSNDNWKRVYKLKKRLKKVKHNLKDYENLFNNNIDLIKVVDKNNKIIKINNLFLDLLDMDKNEVVGKSCQECCAFKLCDKQICPVSRAFKGESFENIEVSTKKNGQSKYFLMSCNTIKDTSGDIVAVVQNYRDITSRMKMENEVRENEERYRSLFEMSPDAIFIVYKNKIINLNKAAKKLCEIKTNKEIIGKHVFEFVHSDSMNEIKKIAKQLCVPGKTSDLQEYKIVTSQGNCIIVEGIVSSFQLKDKCFLQIVLRDITERKRELEKAAFIQQQQLQKKIPLENKLKFEEIYRPANLLSGDFFYFHNIDNENLIGILGDVTGKGVSAALNNSALKVMFFEAINYEKEPMEILRMINNETNIYLGEDYTYIAAICFRFDFSTNTLKVCGAGINCFSVYNKELGYKEYIAKGPSLGMVEEFLSENIEIDFKKEDKYYFYTDGIDFIINDEETKNNLVKYNDINQQKQYIEELIPTKELKDDFTWLALEII